MNERILKMPRLGETMEEGKIVGWLVAAGTGFRRGDAIIEIETDKTIAEYPALGDGTLTETLAAPGDVVTVGQPIARIDIGAGPDWTADEDDTGDGPAAVETDLAMPRLGETMEEGRIVKWLKAPGETFTRGESVLEIETDKTIAEFPALADGTLVAILRGEGEMVDVGQPIARILGAAPDLPAAAETPPVADVPVAPKLPSPPALETARRGLVRATPLARHLARQHGLDLRGLRGTGRRARIEKGDVLAAADARGKAALMHGVDEVRFVELPRGRMAYLDNQAGARTFLLLHGFAGDRTAWAAVAAQLRRAGHRVIIPDLPAHGLTDIGAISAEELSSDLDAFLAEVAAHRQLEVVAHSLGAVAAIDLAAASPARIGRLTLVTPAGLGLEIDGGFIAGMANATQPGEVSHLLRRLTAGGLELSPAALAALTADLGRGRLKALAQAVVGPAGQTVDRAARLARLAETMPVRIVAAVEDRIIPWRHALGVSPRIALHVFTRSGHMPQWDQAGDLVEILLAER